MEITSFTSRDNERYAELKTQIKKGWLMFAQGILEVREKRLYRIEYGTFEEFCKSELGITDSYARKTISSAEVVANLKNGTMVPHLPTSERQARPLTKLEPELQVEAWNEVVEKHGENVTFSKVDEVAKTYKEANEFFKEEKNRKPDMFEGEVMTEKELLAKAKELKASTGSFHISQKQNDWYTPEKYIKSARLIMGSIDLDPASSVYANNTIKADVFYTKEDDGLGKNWSGNIWMNPPYSYPEIGFFVDKLILSEYSQAIVLTNNSTDTSWFWKLLDNCALCCLTKGRINFKNVVGEELAARQGQAFFYFGHKAEEFKNEFSKYGHIIKKIND